MKICINGGHCPGLDSGAVGASGLQEANVAHDIMQLIMYYLQQAEYDVLTVQDNELSVITNISNTFGADLFVSIHCNAAENAEAKGAETFCYQLAGQGEKLARCIQKQIGNILGIVDRGIKTANFAVLRDTICPAVLVETAFISNSDDELLLASNQGKDAFAKAIARGITDYVTV